MKQTQPTKIEGGAAMSEHVPDTGRIRGRYCDGAYLQTGYVTDGGEFDRWLAAHDAKVTAQALNSLANEWREAYSADIFPCSDDDLHHINATSGQNSTAKVAAYFARHWADVLSDRADETARADS